MAQSIAQFFDQVAGGERPQFRAEPWYSREGDCIHYHWQEEEYYGDRIDDKLTVYRSLASGHAVGCQIKGVTALIRKFGDFGVSIGSQDGTPLAIFLCASAVLSAKPSADAEKRQKTYQYVLEQVGKIKVDVEALATEA